MDKTDKVYLLCENKALLDTVAELQAENERLWKALEENTVPTIRTNDYKCQHCGCVEWPSSHCPHCGIERALKAGDE